MNKNLRSNVFNINTKLENSQEILATMKKKVESISDTMGSMAVKTNVGLYKDLQGQMDSYKEMLDEVSRTVSMAQEAALEVHKRDSKMVSGFDI